MEKDLYMKMNAKKTKVLVCSRVNNIKTRIKLKNDETIEEVEDFIYVGSTLRSDVKCKKEIIK